MTMSWLNLLSNVRKFPYLGIYVVMFTDIMQTFLKFSLVCALFVIAFSMGFHALMGRQDSFETFWSSTLKTTVMLIGELEFEDMFFGDTKHDASLMPYQTVTMVFFLCFLIVMPIIIMNLLVGLAVDDIKAGFIFGHLARNPHFDNVTRHHRYSWGTRGFSEWPSGGVIL